MKCIKWSGLILVGCLLSACGIFPSNVGTPAAVNDLNPQLPKNTNVQQRDLSNRIFFAYQQTNLSKVSKAKLDTVVKTMMKNQKQKVLLTAYNNVGDNPDLLQKRLDSVEGYLTGKKVPKKSISQKLAGSRDPLDIYCNVQRDPKSSACQSNRRVLITFK